MTAIARGTHTQSSGFYASHNKTTVWYANVLVVVDGKKANKQLQYTMLHTQKDNMMKTPIRRQCLHYCRVSFQLVLFFTIANSVASDIAKEDDTNFLTGNGNSENEVDSSSNSSNNGSTETSASTVSVSTTDMNGVLIAWYCFVAVAASVFSCVVIALLYRVYYRRFREPADRARRSAAIAERDAALARMQANINKFTAHENTQRTRDLCTWLQPQTMVRRCISTPTFYFIR